MVRSDSAQGRRDRIERGAKQGAALAARADKLAAISEAQRLLDIAPHIDRGANTAEEAQARNEARNEAKRSMAADTYVAPDDCAATATAPVFPGNLNHDDPLNVPIRMLLEDLRRRVKFQTRGFSKTERADIAVDALLIIVRWSRSGALAPIYIGPPNCLPLRRQWFDADKRVAIRDGKRTRPAPNARAEHCMRLAIQQSARKKNADTESALMGRAQARKKSTGTAEDLPISIDAESSTTTLALEAMRRDEARAEFAPCLPDLSEPRLLAETMGITLTAARALVARGYHLRPDQCADEWQVSRQRAIDIISIGAREIRRDYPGRDLLAALSATAPALRENMATRAYQHCAALRDARPWEDSAQLAARAEQSVDEWRSLTGRLPTERRAVEMAARRVGWQPVGAIHPATHIARLLAAEERRGETMAIRGSRGGSHAPMLRDRIGGNPADPMAAPVEPIRAAMAGSYHRGAMYARLAAEERASLAATRGERIHARRAVARRTTDQVDGARGKE